MSDYTVTIDWFDYLVLSHADVIIGLLIAFALLYFGLKFLTRER